jgi:hypothetical protein
MENLLSQNSLRLRGLLNWMTVVKGAEKTVSQSWGLVFTLLGMRMGEKCQNIRNLKKIPL